MPAAGKSLLSGIVEELAPMVKRAVGNSEIAGNLGQRFVAAFHQLHRFQFELFRKCALRLVHRLVPRWRTSTFSSLLSPFSRVKTSLTASSSYWCSLPQKFGPDQQTLFEPFCWLGGDLQRFGC